MRVFSLSLLLSVLSTPVYAEPLQSISPQAVAERLSGLLVYETDEFQIHMSSCPVTAAISPVSESDIFLYQEQARQDRLDQPYRQRLLKISAPSKDVVTSDSHKLSEPERWVGLCRKPQRDRTFAQTDVLPAHCTVSLKQDGVDFIGVTPEPGCPSTYRGATYVRNRVILSPDGMKTYDQGVDADGNRVWGAEDEPYEFEKVTPPESQG